jgi:tRNA(fMet)-specific endonuclease VapC
MKRYALDSNIISYALRGDLPVLRHITDAESRGDVLTIPAFVYYEVGRGLAAGKAVSKQAAFDYLCERFTLADLDREAFTIAIKIYAALREAGTPLDDGDILIASICIRHDLTLVTANERHFSRIPGLNYENWA